MEDAVPEVLNYRTRCYQLDLQGYSVEHDEEAVQDLVHSRYHSISLHLGDENIQREGTTKITRDIFSGANDKRQNAQIFLENLEKLSNKQQSDELRQLLTKALEQPGYTPVNSVETRGDVDSLSVDNSSGNFKIDVGSFKEMTLNRAIYSDTGEFPDDIASERVINKDEVLINISTKKGQQAKDKLFLDFFKMYTKRSLKDVDNKSSTTPLRLVAESRLK